MCVCVCVYIHARDSHTHTNTHRDEPGYNDIGLYNTSSITSDILCY